MAVSLNSIIGFNSTLQPKHRQHDSRSPSMSFPTFRSTSKLQRLIPSVADSDQVATNSNELNPVPNKASEEGGQSPAPAQPQSRPKRPSSLTARERLKAARVLSRYPESKPSKKDKGKKVLDALMESSDKGKKRSRLPEAPTNMLDDAKRGMPKPGLTFQFPGGSDLLVIVFSFVFISSVMFATTFIVWKVGAIHFNEY